jgi:hypothetical protein
MEYFAQLRLDRYLICDDCGDFVLRAISKALRARAGLGAI